MKKVGKTTRSFRYDLNQIPYDYTLEVMNRFKGLNLVDIMSETTKDGICNCTKGGEQIIPKRKKCKKAKWLSEETLQIAEKRRERYGKGERKRYTQLNAEFKRLERRDKSFLSVQCKEKKTTVRERLEISSRKLEISREYSIQKWT